MEGQGKSNDERKYADIPSGSLDPADHRQPLRLYCS